MVGCECFMKPAPGVLSVILVVRHIIILNYVTIVFLFSVWAIFCLK